MSDDTITIPVETPGAPEAAAALGRIGNEAESLGHKATQAAAAFNQLYAAFRTIASAIGTLVTNVGELSAEQEHLNSMSRQLGLDFDEAAGAAGRFVDEVDVMNAAGEFAARGIHLTQEEMNALTHAAARNAQQTGVEVPQALAALTSALASGRERALAPYGQELANAARNGYNLGEGLRAVVEQERHMATATDDARTAQKALADSFGDALRGLSTWVSNLIGLPGILSDVTRGLANVASGIAEINRAEANAEAQLREGGARTRALEQFAAVNRQLTARAQELGIERSQVAVPNVNQMTTEEIAQITSRMRGGIERTAAPREIAPDLGFAAAAGQRGPVVIDLRVRTQATDIARTDAEFTAALAAIQHPANDVENQRRTLLAAVQGGTRELEEHREAARRAAAAAAEAERAARRQVGERDAPGGVASAAAHAEQEQSRHNAHMMIEQMRRDVEETHRLVEAIAREETRAAESAFRALMGLQEASQSAARLEREEFDRWLREQAAIENMRASAADRVQAEADKEARLLNHRRELHR